ncbi:MAG: cysteine--tRNA ligase, partial [Clostridiales bacterium]|nr:cysteine--tRNA ligase [Clostridiales bacterium]
NEFLLVDGGKMSKSLGNLYTIDELISRGYSPLTYRYFCMNTHYRNKLNFTFEGLDAAQTTYNRLRGIISGAKDAPAGSPDTVKKLNEYKAKIIDAVCDDLNFPLALGELWTAVKSPCRELYDMAVSLDALFGLDLHLPVEKQEEQIPDEVKAIADERFEARKNKDWAKSDALRNKLDELGYSVLDNKTGYELKKK